MEGRYRIGNYEATCGQGFYCVLRVCALPDADFFWARKVVKIEAKDKKWQR